MSGDVLLIDNLDSFTFNLVEAIQRLGRKVRVLRSSVPAHTALAAAEESGATLLLSPGPGTPGDAGCCLELIALAKGKVPLAGICLGHQAIVLEAGGTVERAPEPVHGKASIVHHDGIGPFEGIEGPVQIGRYHSLCTRNLPPRFRVHAEVDGMAMAISDPQARQAGLQFHPESILTPTGNAILVNLLRI
ncbi:MAG: gamma-glutamyl-gamma-aminobutyrate hydrolase family protein [Alphaproteobacteria bacterium]|nr:gamma-glutamyl-gamma-aminobutyrate hydrolase family protein [Alphaproteobacteria bacterium]